MLTRTKKIMVCITVFTVISIFSSITAFALSYHNVSSSVTQAKSNWCWAASSEKCGGFTLWMQESETSDIDQYDVVRHFKGDSLPDVGASLEETRDATNYVYDSSGQSSYFVRTYSTLSYDSVKYWLGNGDLIAVWMVVDENSNVLYHASTLTGYDDSADLLIYEDPWEGSEYWVTDDVFRNGFFVPSDTDLVAQWAYTVY